MAGVVLHVPFACVEAPTPMHAPLSQRRGVCVQLRPAVALWADMAALGVRPNVAAYDALINCCAETGALQRGLRLADEALRGGLRADCSTVNAVIKVSAPPAMPATASHTASVLCSRSGALPGCWLLQSFKANAVAGDNQLFL